MWTILCCSLRAAPDSGGGLAETNKQRSETFSPGFSAAAAVHSNASAAVHQCSAALTL